MSESVSELKRYLNLFLRFLLITSCWFYRFSFAADRITSDRSVGDGDVIISSGERFALGFFSPKDSDLRYVGIWYYRVTTQSVVWVANRDNPISGKDGVFTIGEDGNLIVFNRNRDNIIWSSNVTVSSSSSNSTLVLTDWGNLVLFRDENPNTILWQSFDHPTDTYLPNMKVYMNVEDGGEKRIFTSWKSISDPSQGNFTMGVDPRGSPQIIIWSGLNRHWRSGHWNGLMFTGVPNIRAVYLFGFKLINEGDGRLYFTYTLSNNSNLVRFMIDYEGAERQELWNEAGKEWNLIQSHPVDECGRYNFCGAFAKCNEMDVGKCNCIEGFVAKDVGCVRRTRLECQENASNKSSHDGVRTDGFVRVERVKLPDFVDYVGSKDANECEKMCLANCSCTAYAFVSGINCMMWNRDLVDVQQFEEGGNTLFVRVARSELNEKNRATRVIIITIVLISSFLVAVSVWLIRKRKAKHNDILSRIKTTKTGPGEEFSADFSGTLIDLADLRGHHNTGTELTIFSFAFVAAATDNFSEMNKLGQGGFGHVYMGTLPGGEKIAVKRMSRKSGQGLEEFKNEITLIAKLQHRNLVRLLGCCIQGDEKMLLYEYMSNKSLDFYIFDADKRSLLNWNERFNIIKGIARGILYLHRDSRLRIIHRDLKASNILLDEEMNPKISDFGMARMFGGSQNEANTNRIVGTYGYMAPEYAMEGLFSVKSDVYSFGVLLLEIISGQRNTGFRQGDHSSIIRYAWDLWDNARAIEMLDPSISNSCNNLEQVFRLIHIGMLCVQDIASDRPNMAAVMLMLETEGLTLPMPAEPTFTSMRHNVGTDMWNNIENQDVVSSNNVTISVIIGR